MSSLIPSPLILSFPSMGLGMRLALEHKKDKWGLTDMLMCSLIGLSPFHSNIVFRLIKDSRDPETQAKFHSIVTDAHVYLVDLIKAYITR